MTFLNLHFHIVNFLKKLLRCIIFSIIIISFLKIMTLSQLIDQIQIGADHEIQLIPILNNANLNATIQLPSPYIEIQSNQLNVTALSELLSLALLPYSSSEDQTVHSQSLHNQQPIVNEDGESESESDQTLSDGKSMKTGKLNDQSHMLWQSSGVLTKGNCPKNVLIENCFGLELSDDPSQNLDPGGRTPRQRIEFLTPGFGDGDTATYTWSSYLDSRVQTTNHFFHLFQIYSRGDDGPMLTLDIKDQLTSILDPLRCSDDCGDGTQMDFESFKSRTISHALKVTFGPLGKIDYVLGDRLTRQVQLGYSMHGGRVGSGSTSLKFGTYRAAVDGMGSSLAYVGDFRSHT
ncbi:uncharacterized protein MELLADRAFT_90136 [Melampsora larici-populina 98AG31]|uniref:Uncharacterized protein n=1 Tax=Melampsora larici-populina (strain 98AG31 / pathotype 3-4-7) TaxID=747676 RepID=F4RVT8_MELLP|nr:uncharacterized protein MELLADRAFT_90136 [Melampsora larici-populina 98AG31]EGG03415.1 hypothetical protein MELLADRAFT_90136 [Melampsora larici-populina 98AG31]